MKKILALAATAFMAHSAQAAYTQVVIEAESAAGGTVTSDLEASGNSTVKRSTDGVYVWWQTNTSNLDIGSYSVYARVALSAGTTSANFGPQIFYGTSNLVNLNAVITNRAYQWVRIGSFDLAQIGGVLRISDWSSAGLSVDKMAIVKDVTVEAELVTNANIINDSNASGGRAVTRTTAGNYAWWLPPQADMKPGDYIVEARLASADGQAHNFGEVIAQDNVDSPVANANISTTAYQWSKLNSFVYAGGTQSLRVGDYSAPNLKLDKLRLVRRTPVDSKSAVQALYAEGAAALGPREEIIFNGIPNGLSSLKDPGRVSIVQANANTIYAYFRQEMSDGSGVFKIYMATSTDGGKTFNVHPAPVIEAPTALGNIGTAYDQHVTKKADGYYMVFESTTHSNFCAAAAYSPDGVNNWVVRHIPVCPNGTASLGASVPNYYTDVDTGQQYLQWATVDKETSTTRRYQYPLINGLFSGTLVFSTANQIDAYRFPQAPAAWESNNNSAGDTVYEDGHYYMVYDGSTNYDCNGRWAFGITRSNTPGNLNSWRKSAKNPFMQAQNTTSCWIQYPDLVSLPGGTYLYYQNAEVNYATSRTIFRSLVRTN